MKLSAVREHFDLGLTDNLLSSCQIVKNGCALGPYIERL
jgi:hypothetical protein